MIANQELAVLFRKDVVGNSGDVQSLPEVPAELEHERGLAAAHRSTDTHSKSPLGKVAREREVPFMEMAGVIEVFVRVAVVAVMMVVMHG